MTSKIAPTLIRSSASVGLLARKIAAPQRNGAMRIVRSVFAVGR